MADEPEKKATIYESELIWAYFAIGVFALAILLRFVWGREGLMTEDFSYQRFLVLIAAAGFGFGLGWLLYPRQFFFPKGD